MIHRWVVLKSPSDTSRPRKLKFSDEDLLDSSSFCDAFIRRHAELYKSLDQKRLFSDDFTVHVSLQADSPSLNTIDDLGVAEESPICVVYRGATATSQETPSSSTEVFLILPSH